MTTTGTKGKENIEYVTHEGVEIYVKPKGVLSLQKRYHRSEHWVITKGTQKITLNKKKIYSSKIKYYLNDFEFCLIKFFIIHFDW